MRLNISLRSQSKYLLFGIGDQPIGTFAATSRERTLVTFPVTAAQFGTGDVAELILDVDQTFTPGGGDTRELGIQVFHTFVDAK